jgi:hypothetical protein
VDFEFKEYLYVRISQKRFFFSLPRIPSGFSHRVAGEVIKIDFTANSRDENFFTFVSKRKLSHLTL